MDQRTQDCKGAASDRTAVNVLKPDNGYFSEILRKLLLIVLEARSKAWDIRQRDANAVVVCKNRPHRYARQNIILAGVELKLADPYF